MKYVEEKLCPILGDIRKGEPRSCVILGGAAFHMDEHIREAIESKGSYLLYTEPYSSDINQIDKCAVLTKHL